MVRVHFIRGPNLFWNGSGVGLGPLHPGIQSIWKESGVRIHCIRGPSLFWNGSGDGVGPDPLHPGTQSILKWIRGGAGSSASGDPVYFEMDPGTGWVRIHCIRGPSLIWNGSGVGLGPLHQGIQSIWKGSGVRMHCIRESSTLDMDPGSGSTASGDPDSPYPVSSIEH